MIENKDLPNEFVSIRQVWLQQINRCSEAMTIRYKTDITVSGGYGNISDVGVETVIESVVTLYISLVDYGEATIKTEVKKKLMEFKDEPGYKEEKSYGQIIWNRRNQG